MTISKPVHGLKFSGWPGDINPGSHSWKDTLYNHKILREGFNFFFFFFSSSSFSASKQCFCNLLEVGVRADVLVLSVSWEQSLLGPQFNLGKFPRRHPTSHLGFDMCPHHSAGLPKPNSGFPGMVKTLRPKSGLDVVTSLSRFWLSLGFGLGNFLWSCQFFSALN